MLHGHNTTKQSNECYSDLGLMFLVHLPTWLPYREQLFDFPKAFHIRYSWNHAHQVIKYNSLALRLAAR